MIKVVNVSRGARSTAPAIRLTAKGCHMNAALKRLLKTGQRFEVGFDDDWNQLFLRIRSEGEGWAISNSLAMRSLLLANGWKKGVYIAVKSRDADWALQFNGPKRGGESK